MKRNTSFTHHFRNGVSILFGILLLSVSLSSCLDETWVEPSGSEQGIKMYIRIPAPTIGQTRAGETQNDDYVDPSSVYVFVLSGITNDNDHRVLQVVNAVAGTEGLFYAKLTPSAEATHVYIVANAKDIIEEKELTKMTLGQLKLQLKKSVGTTGDVISGSINPQPMFGTFELPAGGIVPETTIGKAGDPVMLARTTSKITITDNTNSINFKLVGANLVNAPQGGYIVSGQATNDKRLPTGLEGDITKMISTPSAGNEKETVLYCFESAETKGTSTYVIIEAKYLSNTYYYRLNLNNNELDYPLLRNNHYMVNIKKVNKEGYTTIEGAMKNPSNIDYVVNVVDETGRNMVSNGKYYLAVSQTEYYYITEEGEEFGEQTVATVTHNAPLDVSRSCTTASSDVNISGFPPTGESFLLKVKMPKNTKKATIKLTLGDLEREITVYHQTVKNIHFGSTLDFSAKGYIAGKVDTKDQLFVKLAKTAHAPDKELSSSLENKEGNMFIRIDGYTGVDEKDIRYPAVDLFREDSLGNARVVFKQEMYNIYKDIVNQAKLAPYTYVGTFHRHNETGERLISIDAKNLNAGDIKPGNNFEWKVFIVAGDFIRLSDKWSNDTHVTTHHPYGVGYTTVSESDYNIETEGQIAREDQKTELNGKGPIYFRVGLTSTLAGASSKPRYGLIAVVVNPTSATPVTRYIYVRQGEEADYLMRKEDPMKRDDHGVADAEWPTRPLVEKFSPYNLTDPNNNSPSLPHKTDPTDFVKFPSQAGYMYEAVYSWKDYGDKYGKGRGWLANRTTNDYSKLTYTDPWDTKFEICPKGYRRPKGHENNMEEGLLGGVMSSPIRQSLWLYPRIGTISETQNFIIGYLADGYYDRRRMSGEMNEMLGAGLVNNQATYVSDNETIAYIGALAFNPYNSASLFIPFSGTRQGGYHQNYGRNGYIWTSNRNETLNFWTAAVGLLDDPNNGSNPILKFRADNYGTDSNQAISVRCVKD